ncbi:hypothetical protein D9M68_386600 [compost metagenome]
MTSHRRRLHPLGVSIPKSRTRTGGIGQGAPAPVAVLRAARLALTLLTSQFFDDRVSLDAHV